MKKLVALLCMLVLCLSVFNVASACGKYPDDYITSRTGNDRYRNMGSDGHQWAIEFAEVCTKCGGLHGYVYMYTGNILPHQLKKQNYHSGQYHYFYSSCTVCYAQYDRKRGLCPGTDTIPHITEYSAQPYAVCLIN